MKKKEELQVAEKPEVKLLNDDSEPVAVKDSDAEMSLYEYERHYVQYENVARARFVLYVAASLVGVIIFTCLTFLVLRFWDIHMYAGIAALVVAIAVFVFCYIVPLVKILTSDYFITNVNHTNAHKAQVHNRELRKKLASKMVEFSSSVNGIGWCKDDTCNELKLALSHDNNEMIKEKLTKLYQGPVKQDAKKMILKKSLKCGIYTAISQDGKADAVIVAALNFQLVRDLVYIYGFRPTDTKLVRIFTAVLENVLISYGVGKIEVGEKILSSFSKVPFISIFSSLIDSGIQGLADGLLTLRIGYQTIHYLNKEYKLQTILDGVSVDVGAAEEEKAEHTLKEEYDAEEKKLKTAKA